MGRIARRVGIGVAALIAALAGYLLGWPVPVEPEAWDCPPHDPAGWHPAALHATRIALAEGHGPEDVERDTRGRVYSGDQDGRILRWDRDDADPVVLAETGGRPLGLHWDADGRLLVADAFAGLLRVDPDTGAMSTLATTCGGAPLVFTDDLDVAEDGAIWFTDATVRFDQHHWKMDLLENRGSGRLCRWQDGDGSDATEVLGGLYFANGVALDPAGRFVLINETSRYRVRRLWLTGPRAGRDDVLIDDLPGFPDGISTGTGGVFWIAVASPRNPLVDGAAGSPWLRKLMVRLPEVLQPKPERTARVVGVDADGVVRFDLFDPEGADITTVTSVQERDGRLLLGSLTDTAWAWMARPSD